MFYFVGYRRTNGTAGGIIRRLFLPRILRCNIRLCRYRGRRLEREVDESGGQRSRRQSRTLDMRLMRCWASVQHDIHRGFGSLGDMSSFVRRFHRGFGSLGDMSSFVGRFHWWSCGRPTAGRRKTFPWRFDIRSFYFYARSAWDSK
jgi:hypothetical protein